MSVPEVTPVPKASSSVPVPLAFASKVMGVLVESISADTTPESPLAPKINFGVRITKAVEVTGTLVLFASASEVPAINVRVPEGRNGGNCGSVIAPVEFNVMSVPATVPCPNTFPEPTFSMTVLLLAKAVEESKVIPVLVAVTGPPSSSSVPSSTLPPARNDKCRVVVPPELPCHDKAPPLVVKTAKVLPVSVEMPIVICGA